MRRFTIKLLPADYGDSIWIEYGEGEKNHYVLIDGGTASTKPKILDQIQLIPEGKRVLDLIVVTHIDQDHIQGIQKILEDEHLTCTVRDFWFNGWRHLNDSPTSEEFGAKQAELMTKDILRHNLPWNKAFGNEAVVINGGALPVIKLQGGMTLTILSPTLKALENLKPVWASEVAKASLVPGYGDREEVTLNDPKIEVYGSSLPDVDALNKEPFQEENSAANASSIAFIAEYGEKRALFLGDAQPSRIISSLRSIQKTGKISFDFIKVSHHGSSGNTSPELLDLIDCKLFGISTSGTRFFNPKLDTIARIVKRTGPNTQLLFNYTSDYNRVWNASTLKLIHRYEAKYPSNEGIQVDLC